MTDILMAEDGDLPDSPHHAQSDERLELTAQRIRADFETHENEWPLDQRVGHPWIEWTQQRPPPVETIASELAESAEEDPRVDRARLNGTFDRDNQLIRVEGTIYVQLEDGIEPLDLELAAAPTGQHATPTVRLIHQSSGGVL